MKTAIAEIKDPVKRLFAFAKERYAVFQRRQAGMQPPWSEDEIIRNFRFCNVYREDDKVTAWIRDNWRLPHKDDPDLWFAMAVARILNLPESLSVMGYPVPFRKHIHSRYLLRHKQAGGQIFNSAYIVATGGVPVNDIRHMVAKTIGKEIALTTPKLAYIFSEIFQPLWEQRETLRPKPNDTLNSYHQLLMMQPGFGSFLAAQVIADLKYVRPLMGASDWDTFAASGPGSRHGLNYILGKPRKAPWSEDDWRLALARLRADLLPLFERAQMPRPHAQDCQNLLCEYSKMHRAVFEGKMPKQKYRWQERR